MKTLSILGGGQLGRSLGRLWADAGQFEILDVLCRSIDKARSAVAFIGAGQACDRIGALQRADIWLISTPDDQIAGVCEALAAAGKIGPGAIVFHCSGAYASPVLKAAADLGAGVASVHPIRSFAIPEQVVHSFGGTFCGVEGMPMALDILAPAFTALGAQLVPVRAEAKTVYHAAAVFASNYLVTLLELARQAYVEAGIPPAQAMRMMEPLVRNTVDNIFEKGSAAALSGPIARGDVGTVMRQYRAINGWNKRYGALYKQLGRLTWTLAKTRDK